jgi:hypothetical protein
MSDYTLTPITEEPLEDQAMLGRVLETVRDYPVLSGSELRGAQAAGRHEVRLTLETLSLAESAHLWLALQEPYRPAEACVAPIVEA